ncbi:hypothetical protein B9G53_05895 [Pseudanabaena sp. SR411]|uniref:nSTAND1 domain-containing NTPase n=1 Tax=Pseudanabaena sp. SR411 TaxID=1980935 RepID=UPI000B9828AD|nr:CHAT domain-containing protein [Pseudanabaena sp. SR411]OYQ65933.1 hypothetical protein B9G53_05895 [Pseudanabaena sp. SR411]
MAKKISLIATASDNNGFNVIVKISDDQLTHKEEIKGRSAVLTESDAVLKACKEWVERYKEITPYLGNTWHFEALTLQNNLEGNKEAAFKRCQEAGDQLIRIFNQWLNQDEFKEIRDGLESYLKEPSESIRFLLETNILELHQLPWQEWDCLKGLNVEVSISSSNFEKVSEPKKHQDQVKILAVLGSKTEIQEQKTAIANLELKSNAKVIWVDSNQRKQLKDLLENETIDIFFFAGHGETSRDRKFGRILIDENNKDWLTISELREELNQAIQNKKRLKLAIISACSGLGLAYQLTEGEKLYLPQVIVMKNELPVRIAPVFLRYFLEEYTTGKSLYTSVQHTRQELKKLESSYPYASWLPIIFQNQGETPSRWIDLGGISTCQPYRGLNTFQEKDSTFFFGREHFTENLCKAIKKHSFIAIVGASGSGKSSVVFAGIIPSLRSKNEYLIVSLRVGVSPFYSLAESISHLNPDKDINSLVEQLKDNSIELSYLIEDLFVHNQKHFLLVIDQFEEIYTLCSDEFERLAFLSCLLKAIKETKKFTLLITLRGDFYGKAIEYPDLAEYLQSACFNLSQMRRNELELAIVKPAQLLEIGLEKGLKELLITSIGFHEYEVEGQGLSTSNLSLLSFTLEMLWQRQREGLLTIQAYREIGGLENCLNQYAESIFQNLTSNDKERAEKVFIQLVQIGIGTEYTRRIASKNQIGESNWDLVQLLADRRLIVTNFNSNTNEETAEIIHEVLIGNWQRLSDWLVNNRDFRVWQQRLRDFLSMYQTKSTSKSREKALLKDLLLTQSIEWLRERPDELTNEEKYFIDQSRKYRERQSRNTILSLIGGIVISLGLAGFATFQSFQRQRALVAEEQAKTEAEIQRINFEVISSSRLSKNLLASNRKLEALTVALRSARLLQKNKFKVNADNQSQTTLALQQALYQTREFNRIEGHTNQTIGVEFSPTGNFLASASDDGTIKLWDLSGRLIRTIEVIPKVTSEQVQEELEKITENPDYKNPQQIGGGKINQFSISPDGQTIAVAVFTLPPFNYSDIRSYYGNSNLLDISRNSQEVQLWSTEGKLIRTLKGHQISVQVVKFSPDGKLIASGSQDKTVKIWTPDGQLVKTLQHDFLIEDIAFSPNSKMIVSVGDKTGKLWNIDGKLINIFSGHDIAVENVAFSPDGQTIASNDAHGIVKLWNIGGKELKTLNTQEKTFLMPNPIVFSPDGKLIATGSKTIKLWKLDGTLVDSFEAHNTPMYDLSFSPDGKSLASAGGQEHTIKIWSVDANKPITLPTGSKKFSFSHDDKFIAIAKGISINLWNRDGNLIKTFEGHKETVNSLSFSPDDKLLASVSGYDDTLGTILDLLGAEMDASMKISRTPEDKASPEKRAENLLKRGANRTEKLHDRSIKIWDVSNNKLIKNIDVTIKQVINEGHQFGARAISFSPDGKSLASVGGTELKLWDLSGSYGVLTNELSDINQLLDVKYSSDSKMLALSIGKNLNIYSKNKNNNWQVKNTLKGHQKEIISINFSPDNSMIASTSFDKTVKIWKIDGTLLTTINQFKEHVIYAAFTPDGKKVVTSGHDGIQIWDLYGKRLSEFGGTIDITNEITVGISYEKNSDNTLTVKRVYDSSPAKDVGIREGDMILYIGNQPTKKLDIEKANNLIKDESGANLTLKLSRKNSDDFEVSITRRKFKYTETVPINYNSVSFSPDGQTMASAGGDNKVRIWTADGKLLKTFEGHQGYVWKVEFSPDGKTIASASSDKTVKLWNLDGQLIKTLDGHGNKVWDVKFSPDGNFLASVTEDGMIRLWGKDGTFVKPILGKTTTKISGNGRTIDFTPDGKSLILGNDYDIEFWNLQGDLLNVLANQMRVWFSSDGNVRTSEISDSSGSGHKNLIYSISHSPNGKLFASTSEDKTIKIWGIDGTLITTIQNNNPILEVQFSPDNKMLASAGKDQTVRLWNLEGNLLKIFRGHNAQVNSVAFSPNGTLLASGSLDKSVKLWTLDGTLLETFPSKDEVKQVGFSHDGKILVTATNDEVTLWNFDLDDLVIKSCNYIGNYLRTNSALNQEDKNLCNHI